MPSETKAFTIITRVYKKFDYFNSINLLVIFKDFRNITFSKPSIRKSTSAISKPEISSTKIETVNLTFFIIILGFLLY